MSVTITKYYSSTLNRMDLSRMDIDRRPLPLPSHIHYELLLQLLERQTAQDIHQAPPQKEQVQALIGTLRKAFSQQKQLEESCHRARIPVEYHWSLNTDH